MLNEKIIIELFPELCNISDMNLQRNCIETIQEALDCGGWKNPKEIEALPAAAKDGPRKVEQIRQTAAMAATGFDCISEWIWEVAVCERDVIIAAALLCDIGEFVVKGPAPVEEAELYNKAEWGGFLAQKHALPLKVVQIILTLNPMMAPEGSNALMTNEGRFVKTSYCCILEMLA